MRMAGGPFVCSFVRSLVHSGGVPLSSFVVRTGRCISSEARGRQLGNVG